MSDRQLIRLEKKLDAMALEQLREVAAQLYDELEQCKKELNWERDNAEFWREQVFNLQTQLTDDQSLGMNMRGELSIVTN
jgi:hypothetical protein